MPNIDKNENARAPNVQGFNPRPMLRADFELAWLNRTQLENVDFGDVIHS
jgi:hypothetical protein